MKSLLLILFLAVIVGCSHAQSAVSPLKPGDSPILTSTGNITTNITKSVSQFGLPFASGTYQITGALDPVIEANVSAGSSSVFSEFTGNPTYFQMFYLGTDSLDVTAAFYNNSAGTGTAINSYSVLQGIPYEWDTSAGTGSLVIACSASWSSLKVTAGTTAQGSASSSPSTNIHVRSSFSQ